MRLLVLVTQSQKDAQLLWRPLRIAVDMGENKDGKTVPQIGEWRLNPMNTNAYVFNSQYSELALNRNSLSTS